MKKLMTILFLLTASLTLLSGCGRSSASEEQNAFDEIRSHLIQEAKADGVDLEAMVQDEMNAYEEKHQAYEESRATAIANRDYIESTYYGELDELLNIYNNSTNPSEILTAAQSYNALYGEMVQVCIDNNIAYKWGNVPYFSIRRSEYMYKVAYYGKAQYLLEDGMNLGAIYSDFYDVEDAGKDGDDPENYSSTLYLYEEDDYGNYTRVIFVLNDLSVVELDLTQYENDPVYSVENVNDHLISFSGCSHGDFYTMVFDYTQPGAPRIHNTLTDGDFRMSDTWSWDWCCPEDGLDYMLSLLN